MGGVKHFQAEITHRRWNEETKRWYEVSDGVDEKAPGPIQVFLKLSRTGEMNQWWEDPVKETSFNRSNRKMLKKAIEEGKFRKNEQRGISENSTPRQG